MRSRITPHLRRRALRIAPAVAALLLASQAGAYAATPVSWITDPRVTESSALAISRVDPTIAYTLNDDEPNKVAVVYAIRIATGQVVGATTLAGIRSVDPEALAIDSGGYLWYADTGTDGGRDENWGSRPPTLYRFKEQGATTGTVNVTAYPIAYSNDKHENVETLLIRPSDNAKYLITKGVADNSGKRFNLPKTMTAGQVNTATLKQTGMADV